VSDLPAAPKQRSAYTVQETAAYFAAKVKRIADRSESIRDRIGLDSVAGFLSRIADDDLAVFAGDGPAETPAATPFGEPLSRERSAQMWQDLVCNGPCDLTPPHPMHLHEAGGVEPATRPAEPAACPDDHRFLLAALDERYAEIERLTAQRDQEMAWNKTRTEEFTGKLANVVASSEAELVLLRAEVERALLAENEHHVWAEEYRRSTVQAEAKVEDLLAEIERLRAEVARVTANEADETSWHRYYRLCAEGAEATRDAMAPVVAAAVAWEAAGCPSGGDVWVEPLEQALIDAVRAYQQRAGTPTDSGDGETP
jgi:hypothetical protein